MQKWVKKTKDFSTHTLVAVGRNVFFWYVCRSKGCTLNIWFNDYSLLIILDFKVVKIYIECGKEICFDKHLYSVSG